MLYHYLRRHPNDNAVFVFMGVAMLNGILAGSVLGNGPKILVLVQLIIVVPTSVWGFSPKRRMRHDT